MKHSFSSHGLLAVLALIAIAWPLKAGYAVEKTAKYYFDLGTEHMEKGRYSQAVADLTRAIQMNPNYDKAYRQRGNVYFRKGDYDQAIADYNRAMRVAPKVARNYANRALVYLEQGKLDEALADFNEAIALDPKYVKAYSRGDGYIIKRASMTRPLPTATRPSNWTPSWPRLISIRPWPVRRPAATPMPSRLFGTS